MGVNTTLNCQCSFVFDGALKPLGVSVGLSCKLNNGYFSFHLFWWCWIEPNIQRQCFFLLVGRTLKGIQDFWCQCWFVLQTQHWILFFYFWWCWIEPNIQRQCFFLLVGRTLKGIQDFWCQCWFLVQTQQWTLFFKHKCRVFGIEFNIENMKFQCLFLLFCLF